MISYIKGTLAGIMEDGIVLDAGGIGYHVFVPGQVLDALPPVGETLKIHTYLQVREDAMTLFGFLTQEDLRIFKLLLGVSGIGPKGALAVLSVMTTDDLRFAILGEDAKAIARAPGIGNKTAQRLILELKDKVSLDEAFERKAAHTQETSAGSGGNEIKNEAVLALTALGYSSSEALKALNGVEVTDGMDVETLLKLALKQMSFL